MKCSIPLFIAMVLISVSGIAQSTHTVDNSPNSGANFSNLQAAIDAASAGDTIYVHPSTEDYGNITINKLVHLRGIAHHVEYSGGTYASIGNITLNSPIGAQGISISGVRFGNMNSSGSQNYSGLEVSNCRFTGINISAPADNLVVIGNVVDGNSPDVFRNQSSGGWMIVNNFIRQQANSQSWNLFRDFDASDVLKNNIIITDQDNENITMFQNSGSLTAENNIFIFAGNATGMNSGGVEFNNNLTYSVVGQTLGDLSGSNNLNNTEPQFVDIGGSNYYYGYSKDFHLQEGSPAVGAGIGGGDLGIYGSDFEFNKYGYPMDLPYPRVLEIANTVVESGGTLNVTLEAVGN